MEPGQQHNGELGMSGEAEKEKLIDEDAEKKECEHLHNGMEAELVTDPEAKGNVVDYIKGH